MSRLGTPRAREGLALFTLCAVLFLTFLDTTIVSVALADVQGRLHAGIAQLQWMVNGYALVFASLMLVFGSLGDRLGRKRVMLVGLALFCAGSVLAALAPNPDTLIAGRVVMGAGAAASEPGTLSMLRQLFPDPRRRARALGTWAAVSGLALALGPVLGGVLVALGSWRAVFWFNLAAGALVLAAGAVVLAESADPPQGGLDVAGFVFGTLALAALTFAIIVGETAGFFSAPIVVLFVVAGISALAWVRAERRAETPMLDLAYLRRPAFAGALVVALTVFFGIFSIFLFVALYLQTAANYSALRTAAEFAAMAGAMLVSSLLAGRAVATMGPRAPMVLGCLAAGAGVLLCDEALSAHTSAVELGAALALAGFGFGAAVVPVTSVALGEVPPERSGMAASATNTSRELGAVLGVAILGALVNARLSADLTERLHALHIPNAFQLLVLNAVESGQAPSSDPGATKRYGPIVEKVLHAAIDASRSGLHLSLVVAGCSILASALVAFVALGSSRAAMPD